MTTAALDLRLAPVALTAWAAAALATGWPVDRAIAAGLVLLVAGVVATLHERHRTLGGHVTRLRTRVIVGVLISAAAALTIAGLRSGTVQAGPVPSLAGDGAQVSLRASVASDPVTRPGTYSPYVLVRITVDEVTGRGATTQVRSPVLVIGDAGWMRADLGDEVHATGRLRPAEGPDLAGVLIARAPPQITRQSGPVDRAISRVRDGLTEAASVLPPAERALVPALVDGDDTQMPPETVTDFQVTGLTHLLAVSGANLTLMLGFLLVTARWCGVRGRGHIVVGIVGVVFFVLLARPQPSVLRAAAMGVVAIAGLSSGGVRKGVRALCVAVTALVLLDPWLARSVGFLLSTVATAGVLLLAPWWRSCLQRWLPGWLAEAVAVPLAAQLACTPAIAAISGQVSLVAVFTNMMVAPAVGPATVLGLVAGLVAIVNETMGHLVGRLAGVAAWWIVWVAEHASGLAGAASSWPVGPVAIAALTLLCLGLVVVMPTLLGNRLACLGSVAVLVLVIVQPVGRIGWPPDGWIMVACDIGQGDGLVLNAGAGAAVVVDTGPDPALIDQCLERLEVEHVALVVLTHFHADHANGLPGVLEGRQVDEIGVSSLADPPDRAEAVSGWAAAADVPLTEAVVGETRTIGALSWRVIGPVTTPGLRGDGSSTEGSAPNNASVVMSVDTRGHRLLLSGDAEPEEESDILATYDDLDVDVLKVSHHGSANQDPDFVFATRPAVAVISVGLDNGYGHPAPETLGLLAELGAQVYRTDRHGDVAIVDRAGQLAVLTSRTP